MTTHQTFCRYCHAYCPMLAEVEDGKVLSVKPDTSNAMYGGYTCIKGRQLVEQMYQPARLTNCLKKGEDGEFTPITSNVAFDEIAEKVKALVAEHGPRSIATYNGTVAFQNSAQLVYSRAFHNALQSPSYYTSVTIDQPAKVFVGSRIGYWTGGSHSFHDADVVLIIGNNPLVSHYAPPGGVPSVSPADQLRRAQKRGLKLIVVDPRKTELAKRADLHLQVRPGEDATLLSGMLKVILSEGLQDHDFCEQNVAGLASLQAEVSGFDLADVAMRTGVEAALIVEAARLFASGPKGTAITGTGPEMGAHPNLTQHLVASLNIVCGRFYRAGDRLPNPGMLSPPSPKVAQVADVSVAWGQGERCRVRPDLGELVTPGRLGPAREMPTAQLADEILTPGEGQVRALFVIAGNPIMAWPDQEKALAAMKDLELLVCIDPYISATAELADYVLAPKLTLEREDVTLLSDAWYEKPYSQYSRAVIESEHDVIEEWELYWAIADRLNLEINIGRSVIPNQPKPEKFDLLKAITKGSRVDLDWLRDNPGGHIFEEVVSEVQPAPEGAVSKLKLYPDGVEQEFAELRAEPGLNADFPHLLIGFRSKYVLNSFGHNLPALKKKSSTTNPAHLHPADLAALGIEEDDEVQIASSHGQISAIVKADAKIKPGVIAMHHCWGLSPDKQGSVRENGANTNLLVSSETDTQRYTGMTRSSSIPVRIKKSA